MLLVWVLAAALPACAADSFSAQAGPSPDHSPYYYEEIHEPFFRPAPGRPGFLATARPGAAMAVFAARKPRGTLRLFIVGGSTAGGYQGPGDLAWGLGRALPGAAVEVINCGMSGYDSDRERLVLKEILAYEPDAVVFLSGHNDFGVNASAPRPVWLLRAGSLLARFGWFRRLRDRPRPSMAPPDPVRLVEQRRAKLAHLVRNVRAHVRDCRSAGARPVVCLPPVDYEQAAPAGARFPWQDAAFMSAWALFLRGEPGRAAAAWSAQAARLPSDQDELAGALWSYSGRAYGRAGKPDLAREAFQRALEAPARQDLCARSCLDALALAAKEEGAAVADVDGEFRRQAWPRMPGAALFGDSIHWGQERHWLVTNAVVSALRHDPSLRAWPWSKDATEGRPPAESSAMAAARRYHEQAAMFYSLQRVEVMPSISVRALRSLEGAKTLNPRAFTDPRRLLDAARLAYRSFDARLPQFAGTPLPERPLPRARLLGYLGLMELEEGRCGPAAKDLALALESPDADPTLHLARAAALMSCGDGAGARASLEAAESASLYFETAAFRRAFGRP
jgi:hypothetical protein